MVVADVNGDGRGDIVTADNHGVGVSVLLGNGNGTFLPQLTLAGQVSPSSADVADLNNDGKPDIFFVNANSADINVYLGNGNGTFAAGAAHLRPGRFRRTSRRRISTGTGSRTCWWRKGRRAWWGS